MSDGDGWRLPCGHVVLTEGQPHYCDYLSLGPLLYLGTPYAATNPRDAAHHDELQFVVVHQMFEIELHLQAVTLRRVIVVLDDDDFDEAIALMKRVIHITHVYNALVRQLLTMTSASFLSFRDLLAPASGAESQGFRVVELLSGLTPASPYGTPHPQRPVMTYRALLDRELGKSHGAMESKWWTSHLDDVASEQNLATAFLAAVARQGFQLDAIPADHPLNKLRAKLRDYERAFLGFRKSHLQTVAFHIGDKPGSGNTSGVQFLQSVLQHARFFPFLAEPENA